LRRSDRERRLPERYSPSDFRSNFALSITDDDPITVREAVDSEDGNLWKRAMEEEMASLDNNEAWDLVELPTRRNPIHSKWVFKKKLNAEGKVEKYKAQLVAKGYSQVEGIYFGEIFSPVAKLTSIIFLLSIVVAFDFEIEKNGCEDNIPTWGSERRNLYQATRRLCCEGKEGVGMQDEKVPVWFKTITNNVVSKI
jgi:hypothetical protein